MKNLRVIAIGVGLVFAAAIMLTYATDAFAATPSIAHAVGNTLTLQHMMIATAGAGAASLEELGASIAAYHSETKGVAAKVGAFDGRLAAVEREAKSAREASDRIEIMLNRMPGGIQRGSKDVETPEQKAFGSYIRRGREVMDEQEVKSLAVMPDTAGGYITAPETFVQEILRNVVEMSPVRQIARVTSISTGGAVIPKRTSKMTGRWVTEVEDRTESSPAYGQVNIPVREAAFYVDVSNQLLEDSAFNLEAELAVDFAEEFARLEGSSFVSGDGVIGPSGFMQSSDIGFEVSGSAASIADASGQGNGLIDLFYGIPTIYSRNGTWGMNRKTMGAVRKLKDAENNYIWQSGLSAGQPPTILGRPVVEMADMPDIGAGTFPVIFGDFNAGYRIVDRIQLAILRDPYSLATKGQIRFHARRRVGGAVVKAEALRKLKVAAS